MDRPITFVTTDGRTQIDTGSPLSMILRRVIRKVERTINEPTLSVFRRAEVLVVEDLVPPGTVYRVSFMTRDPRIVKPVVVRFEVSEDKIREMPVGYMEGFFTDMVVQFIHQIRTGLLLQERFYEEGFLSTQAVSLSPEWQDERLESSSGGGGRDWNERRVVEKRKHDRLRVVRIGLCSRREE